MVKVKKTRTMIIGLFVLMGILFNITVYFDNGGVQDSDFALSDLRVSLVDKAYACGPTCPHQENSVCYWDNTSAYFCDPAPGLDWECDTW